MDEIWEGKSGAWQTERGRSRGETETLAERLGEGGLWSETASPVSVHSEENALLCVLTDLC